MLSFFRRLLNSRVGIIVTLGFLVVIAIAFALGDINGFGGNGAPSSGSVARVGSTDITVDELKRQTQDEMENFRQRQPTLDLAQYIAAGGFEGTLERMISGTAIEQFGEKIGLATSKPMIDGQIADVTELQGIDGKFSQEKYDRLLAQRKLTDQKVRQNIARGILAQQLTLPTEGATQVPVSIAAPYAALLLEKRAGTVGFVPTNAIDPGAKPSDAELTAYYKSNLARYTVPERRIIRYAVVSPALLKERTTPTEAEIASAYKAQAARFTASEKRTLSQVVVGDKGAADTLAAKIKGGTPIAVAAKAIGLDAAVLKDQTKADYARQSNAELADAVFAAARGAVVGPIRSALGWTIVHVDGVETIAAKSIDQARVDLTKELAAEKLARSLSDIHDKMDDAISDKATFAELVSDQKLTVQTTPAVIADGRDPDQQKPADPMLSQVVAAGFAAEVGDDPQLVPVGQDGSFAAVTLDKVVPSAAPPFAKIRDYVQRDFVIERARKKARAIAVDIVAKTNKGLPVSLAFAQSGVKLPPLRPVAAARADLAANPRGAPAPLVLMFSMARGTAKLLEAPNNTGYFVVYLAQVERHDASLNQAVVAAMRRDMGKVIGQEYLSQFVQAVRRDVGVKKNDGVIAQARKDLAGGR